MKTLILAALALSAASSAFADTRLTCQAPGSKFSVTVTLNPAGDSGARLHFAPPTPPYRLTCALPQIQPHAGPDQYYPIAFCDDGIRDGGYSILVRGGGFTGITQAIVTAKNFVRNRVVAQLSCRDLDSRF